MLRSIRKFMVANVICQTINNMFLLLSTFNRYPFLISVALFLVWLAGMVWLSYKINYAPRKKKFHAAETEPVGRIRV